MIEKMGVVVRSLVRGVGNTRLFKPRPENLKMPV